MYENGIYINSSGEQNGKDREMEDTGCGRNNSHISKNHCGVPKAGSRVWSIPLGKVHNKVFSCPMQWSGEHRSFVVAAVLKNFHLSGRVNKENFHYWVAENPRELHARPLHSPFGVLCRL
jgi:hypothetical protein